jgi:hypothetical protein
MGFFIVCLFFIVIVSLCLVPEILDHRERMAQIKARNKKDNDK